MTGRARINVLKHIVAALFILATTGCSAVRLWTARDTHYETSTEDIAKYFPLKRGRWWNYYDRGLLYLEHEHYQEALLDFGRAIHKNNVDGRDARTYGMHFTDYFPNRELGIVYCLLGEHEANVTEKEKLFSEAQEKLDVSIDEEETSRAKFYLNRAMAGYWKATGTDSTPPLVWIANNGIDLWESSLALYINKYFTTLKIHASDDESLVGTVWIESFVAAERVDRKELFIESAERTLEKDTVVTVDPNDTEKTIVVKAVDLAGNESRPAVVRLIVDTVPPSAVAKVHADKARLSLLGARIPVDIFAADDRGLKSVRVGEDPYDNRDCRGQVRWEGRFFAEPTDHSFTVEITDRAGNSTTLEVNLESEQYRKVD
jgi:hypothetical protein